MANEYATLLELKAMRRVTDTTNDTALQSALTRASRLIDSICSGDAPAKTTRRFYLDAAATARTYNPQGRVFTVVSGQVLLVDDIGDLTGLIVETGTEAGWTPVAGYETRPDNATTRGRAIEGLLLASGTWPTGATRVRVTAKWGWPAVPDQITQATLLLANRLYMRKDAPEGTLGSADWGEIDMVPRDPDIEALLKPFVWSGTA